MSEQPKDGDLLHNPGECPDRSYGHDCDGTGTWGANPYDLDLYGDATAVFECNGRLIGLTMDI